MPVLAGILIVVIVLSLGEHDADPDGFYHFWTNVWLIIRILFWSAIAFPILVFLFNRRRAFARWFDSIVRWYYFTFYPHPAEPIVTKALRSGTVLDGPSLARALGEVPPGSSTFRSVWFEQAERLIGQMQEMSAVKIQELERRAADDYERAALSTTREAIALAAVALERAKAAWRASESMRTRRASL
jgi:hypothetical protein